MSNRERPLQAAGGLCSPWNALVRFKAELMGLKLSGYTSQLNFLLCAQQIYNTHPSGQRLIPSPDDDGDKSHKRPLLLPLPHT